MGCNTGSLHYADVTYFNDTEATTSGAGGGSHSAERTVALIKDSLRLHHAVTSTEAQRELETRIGATPTTRDRGYAISMWLAAACVSAYPGCKSQALHLLSTKSMADRVERILKVQRAAVGKKFDTSSRQGASRG